MREQTAILETLTRCLPISQDGGRDLDEVVRLLHEIDPDLAPAPVPGQVAVRYRDLRNRIVPGETAVDRE